jgi:hypothetical protein
VICCFDFLVVIDDLPFHTVDVRDARNQTIIFLLRYIPQDGQAFVHAFICAVIIDGFQRSWSVKMHGEFGDIFAERRPTNVELCPYGCPG